MKAKYTRQSLFREVSKFYPRRCMSLSKILTIIKKIITPNKTDRQGVIKTEDFESDEYLLAFDEDYKRKIETDVRPLLKLKRFCGDEIFPITKATWYFSVDDDLGNELWLKINADYGSFFYREFVAGYDPESYILPKWELNYFEDNLQESHLQAGFRGEIPLGLGDWEFTNFYYYEHAPTDKNIIEILERKGDYLLIRITGEVEDVAFYDGSKPKTKLSVITWFVRVTPNLG